MDDPTPNPTTRMETPEAGAAGPGAAPPPPPPAAPPSPTAPPPPPPTSWAPPPGRRSDGGRWWSLVVGLVILGVGLWFFAERTLGIDMPDIRWSQLWPVVLIVIGVVVLVGAMRRDRR
jgi:hypothetical protein